MDGFLVKSLFNLRFVLGGLQRKKKNYCICVVVFHHFERLFDLAIQLACSVLSKSIHLMHYCLFLRELQLCVM